jgi:Secretion system C-terminal sorting domain
MVLHGNYVYANLFEGNVCQNIVIDDSHGKNGPHNTFFRNRAKTYGIFMNNNPASNDQNFIGNEITSTTFLQGFYTLAGTGHFEYGNKKQGTLTPAGTSSLTDVSYCFTTQPGFLINNAWPVIAIPNTYNTGTLPAETRNTSGSKIACNALTTGMTDYEAAINAVHVYPNPTSQFIYINTLISYDEVEVINLLGETVVKQAAPKSIDVSELSNGLYSLVIKARQQVVHSQKIVITK